VSLPRPSVEIFILSSPEVWSQREFTAKSAPDRTKAEHKLLSVVDNLGSVQSGACTHCTLNEKIPLTGPLAPICEARTSSPQLTSFHSLTPQHVSNIDPAAL
jgi:hypothetical protein